MSLKRSYTLLAPLYDLAVKPLFGEMRQRSLNHLPTEPQNILINGIGTGLDIPYLPPQHHYTGIDLTPAMLKRAQKRLNETKLELTLDEADSMALPFGDNTFDSVIMHLILAVVPSPKLALKEACRVLRPGGHIHILDKFLKQGQIAPIRHLVNLFSRHVATQTNIIFENVLTSCPELHVLEDLPVASRGWFRFILLQKNAPITKP